MQIKISIMSKREYVQIYSKEEWKAPFCDFIHMYMKQL